ncbi:related to Nucleoporin NUP145 [Zygosaccharomyces bailii ISA1307]|nr:related to Nucleoporin NUP145 [Zygosaccharomyces bailii ISA1307]
MFNRGANGGSLFGNANTSTPTSTPTPSSNTLQIPQKSGNVFGSANANLGASTPSPSGGLFGNTSSQTGSGGLFGNQSNTSKPLFPSGNSASSTNVAGSLFGTANNNNNNNNITKSNSTTNFTFGNNTLKTNPTNPVTTGSGGKFSHGTSTQSTGLFGGNQSGAFGGGTGFGTPQQQQRQAPMNGDSNPYGLNINNVSIPISNMPAPITSSKNYKSELDGQSGARGLVSSGPSGAESKRNFSISSSNSSNFSTSGTLPSLSHSSLVNKLSARLKTANQTSSIHGIFSPSRNKFWDNHDSGGASNSNAPEYKSPNVNNGLFPSKAISSFSLHKGEVSDMRKLKIDPSRIAAKKLKLLSGMAAATKNHEPENSGMTSLDMKDVDSHTPSIPDNAEANSKEVALNDSVKENKSESDSKNEYWCTPSIEQLSHMSLKQLSVLPDFVIGRRGYGYITFNHEVDLTALAPDFKDELFGKVVIFHPTKTVEVYPDETQKAAVGHGLNVPATITLENIYPIDRKTKRPLKDGSRSEEVQLLIKRLKNMRGMDFISYNPFGGVWTFKVHHFSIWGLVNEEDVEMDTDELKESKQDHISNRSLAFPKSRRSLAQSNTAVEQPSDDSVKTQNDLLELQQQSQLEVNGNFDNQDNGDLFLEEKAYEPEISERDFDGMEVEPTLNLSTDWVSQLKLAGSSLKSVFSSSNNQNVNDRDTEIVFAGLNNNVETEKRIKKERRLTGKVNFAKFCCDSKLLIKDSGDPAGVRTYSPLSPFQKDLRSVDSLFRNQLKGSIIMERPSNSYPIVTQNSLQFRNVVDLHKASDPDSDVWKLCSVLFDMIHLPPEITNAAVREKLLKKERHRLLCEWIIEQTTAEIDGKLKNTVNDLDKIFLHLCKNDVVGATKLAIKSQNGHLAILVTFMGSNDPNICDLAALQLEKWASGGSNVDASVARIYQLMTGDLVNDAFLSLQVIEEFSWLSLLGIILYFGKIDEYSLENLIANFLSFCKNSENDIFFVILSLFSSPASSENLLKKLKLNTTALESLFPWYFVQILRFGTNNKISDGINDKLTLSAIEELRIASLHKEALFAACFISDNSVAKQQIDSLVFHFISELNNGSNSYVLDRLKISKHLVFKAKALCDKYEGDYLSEAQNLLKAKSFKEAEKVIVSIVGPRLIIQESSNRIEELGILGGLLSAFPKNEMENWENGLGVFEKFLKLVLKSEDKEELLTSLVSGLTLMYEENKCYKEIPVCCNIMAQEVVTVIVKKAGKNLDNNLKGSLLRLPLGQPEKSYLESMLAKTI